MAEMMDLPRPPHAAVYEMLHLHFETFLKLGDMAMSTTHHSLSASAA